MDIEEAYRLLELKPGAGLKEIVEARQDQMALWDPERLAKHPRLRSRAPGRIEAIQQAYEIVMRRLDESAQPLPSRRDHPRHPSSESSAAASLFEEVFAPGTTRHKRSGMVWILSVVAFLALLIGFYLLRDSVGAPDAPDPQTGSTGLESPPPPLAGSVLSTADSEGDAETPGGDAATAANGFQPPPPQLPPRRTDGPKLVRRETADGRGAGPSAAPAQNIQESGDWIYRSLLVRSRVARELVDGRLSGWRFQAWEVVRAKPPEYWIDLSAVGENGATAHFVWSVNVRDGLVQAWNQEARDLEASK